MLIAKYDYDMDIKVQRQEAREEGIEKSLKSLMNNANWTIEQAMEMLEIPMEEQSIYREKIKKSTE